MLKINGVAMASPSEFKVDISDLDGETGRNAKGNLIRDRVAVKRKLECAWAPLKDNEISKLLQAVQSSFFQVEYPDPMTGNNQIKTFYVGDRSAPMYWKDGSGQYLWQGLSMNLIER